MSDHGDVRMYYGSAAYSSHKALRQSEEPHVMISAHTKARDWLWDIPELFVDSGGYSLMLSTGEHPEPDTYLDTVVEMGGDLCALQDYPCEPEILREYGRTVRDHQARTTERAAECLAVIQDRGLDVEPVAVVQGWEPGDYLNHVDRLAEQGCLTDHVAIGSVCRRGQTDEIREIITAVRGALPRGTHLHAFGVKYEVLQYADVRDAVDSVDSAAWEIYPNQGGRLETEPAWRTKLMRYLEYWRKVESLTSGTKIDAAKMENQHELTQFQ